MVLKLLRDTSRSTFKKRIWADLQDYIPENKDQRSSTSRYHWASLLIDKFLPIPVPDFVFLGDQLRVPGKRPSHCSKPQSYAFPMSSCFFLVLWDSQIVVAPWHAGCTAVTWLWNHFSTVTETYHVDYLTMHSFLKEMKKCSFMPFLTRHLLGPHLPGR